MSSRPALVDELVSRLTLAEAERLDQAIRYRWSAWARPKQLPPANNDWDILGLVAGKGGGKTRPGAEFIREGAENNPGIRMALVGRTARDTRDTMVLGESGILAISPPWFRPEYKPSKVVVVWPNGAEAHMYSADKPDQLRGPMHHRAWGDEFSAWKSADALTNLLDGLRLGERPQTVLTTTPRRTDLTRDTFLGPRGVDGKRAVTRGMIESGAWELVNKIKDQRTGEDVLLRTLVRRWSTEENALNLSPGYTAKRRAHYAGSSLGRQELDADFLEDIEGALWTLKIIDDLRIVGDPPRLVRIVVAVDPSHADDGGGDACGIIVVGLGEDGHCYVLADRSLNGSPNTWGTKVVSTYHEFRADLVVYEDNDSPGKAGQVKDTIKSVDPRGQIKWHAIHASSDKRTRADPVSSQYESKRVHHVVKETDKPEHLALLEDEMVTWKPNSKKSPNRLDALVHGVSYLVLSAPGANLPPESGKRVSPWRV